MLSERYGVFVHELLEKLSSADISEYMAFDQLKDPEYKEKIKNSMMTQEELTEQQKALFRF